MVPPEYTQHTGQITLEDLQVAYAAASLRPDSIVIPAEMAAALDEFRTATPSESYGFGILSEAECVEVAKNLRVAHCGCGGFMLPKKPEDCP
jgi:hypothetical protein